MKGYEEQGVHGTGLGREACAVARSTPEMPPPTWQLTSRCALKLKPGERELGTLTIFLAGSKLPHFGELDSLPCDGVSLHSTLGPPEIPVEDVVSSLSGAC